MDEEDRTRGWAFLLVGIICLVAAAYMYYKFNAMQRSGGSIRLPAILVLIYEALGKWGAVGVTALFGAIATWMGVEEIRAQREG
jgi:hypothetical protein